MANQTSIKIQEIARKIDELIKRNKVSWFDVFRELERRKIAPKKKIRKKDIWEEVKGMWSKKKIDPLQFERKIRKELEKISYSQK